MEEQDQTWTHWKGYERQKQKMNEDELWPLPEKPQTAFEYESMKRDDREALKGTTEYQEIEEYYDKYHSTIQHNISVHVHKMEMGLEPIGKVQYIGNTFILAVHYPVPKDRQWEEGPDHVYHPPSCIYRQLGYDHEQSRECHCGKKRKKPIFEKMKELEKREAIEEEVPF